MPMSATPVPIPASATPIGRPTASTDPKASRRMNTAAEMPSSSDDGGWNLVNTSPPSSICSPLCAVSSRNRSMSLATCGWARPWNSGNCRRAKATDPSLLICPMPCGEKGLVTCTSWSWATLSSIAVISPLTCGSFTPADDLKTIWPSLPAWSGETSFNMSSTSRDSEEGISKPAGLVAGSALDTTPSPTRATSHRPMTVQRRRKQKRAMRRSTGDLVVDEGSIVNVARVSRKARGHDIGHSRGRRSVPSLLVASALESARLGRRLRLIGPRAHRSGPDRARRARRPARPWVEHRAHRCQRRGDRPGAQHRRRCRRRRLGGHLLRRRAGRARAGTAQRVRAARLVRRSARRGAHPRRQHRRRLPPPRARPRHPTHGASSASSCSPSTAAPSRPSC